MNNVCFVKELINNMDSDIINEEGLDVRKFIECFDFYAIECECVSYSAALNDWVALLAFSDSIARLSWRWNSNKPKLELV